MTGILIDADIYLFRAAQAAEVETHWGDDHWTLHSDAKDILKIFNSDIEKFASELKADEIVLCFSDPSRRSFRHDLWEGYKANRKGTRKPLAYHASREKLMTTYKTVIKPGLEADDVMGIVSTRAPGRYIIVSADKDMKTIPGRLYRGGELVSVSEAEANHWHMMQTLTGDVTDGYPGCPGVGPKKAEELLKQCSGTPLSMWVKVVSAFRAAKLTPDDALLQARLARILRATEWDFDKSEVKLWQPPS